MADEQTFDMQPTSLATTGTYYPLRFRLGTPSKEQARFVAGKLLTRYLGRTLTYAQWREAGEFTVTWQDDGGKQRTSRRLKFEWLVDHLREQAQFSPNELDLPPIGISWLDESVEVGLPFHAPATGGGNEALTSVFPPALSDSFPVQPMLDREGRAFSSLQPMLLQSWLEVRTRLVDQSDRLFRGYDWLRDLFLNVSTMVSAVDNTLHQVYYRAQYEANAEGWKFDPARLGPATARRLKDKLAWIGIITGKPLDDCTGEIARFVQIKDLRNHLAHFDPPTLAFTIEDVADWLNASEAVAKLLVAIRERINQPLSQPLIQLLLARPVDWYPSDAGKRRVPQGAHVGYASSCWKSSTAA